MRYPLNESLDAVPLVAQKHAYVVVAESKIMVSSQLQYGWGGRVRDREGGEWEGRGGGRGRGRERTSKDLI